MLNPMFVCVFQTQAVPLIRQLDQAPINKQFFVYAIVSGLNDCIRNGSRGSLWMAFHSFSGLRHSYLGLPSSETSFGLGVVSWIE